MAKNKLPYPPDSNNPIVVLRSLSLDKEMHFLEELLSANAAGDTDRAAKCATAALLSTMDRTIVNAMVGVVSNLAYSTNKFPPSIKALLCKATDLGFHEFAYNAANQIVMSAKTAKGYKEAERVFKIAMAYAENPATQAAAHVNYCPIIRDGLISGVPDWPAAVEIYEAAARMGLVKAMFNAGNVCSWLASQGNREYAARAAHWFGHALEYRATRKPTLDMESPEELEEIFENCMGGLSGLHIDARFEGADLEEGIRWAKELKNKGNPEGTHNLGVGYIRRLAQMNAQPKKSPGENWRSVLSTMDWHFQGAMSTHTIPVAVHLDKRGRTEVDRQDVVLDDGSTISLFVTHAPCLPQFDGNALICAVANQLVNLHPDRFLLVSRRSLFIEKDGRSYTPIYVWQHEKFSRQSLWMSGSPELFLQQAKMDVDFLDERFSNWTCMIPIAVNALDEGFVVAKSATYNQPWVGVGEPWRMPFVSKENLAKVGIPTAG